MEKEETMKRLLLPILVLIFMASNVYPEVRIGVINSQVIVQKTNIGKEFQDRLRKWQRSKSEVIQKRQNAIKKLQTELASPALNSDTRTKKTRELEDQRINYNRLIQDFQRDVRVQEQKEMVALQKEIMPVIQQVGKSKGFTLILDISAGIAYFDTTVDLTESVIKAIDIKFPGK